MADGAWTATRDRHDAHAWRLTRTDDQQADSEPVESPRARVYGVLDRDDRAWVAIDGNVIVVAPDETASRRARRHSSSSGDALSAPMPATVVAVHVAEGDDVQAGDVLMLLEAMKMEVPLRAPHAGRVTSLRCTPGALVQPGLALVTIEEAP